MSGIGRSGTGALKVDGKVVSTQKMERTIPLILQWDETFDVGADTGTPVDDKDYTGSVRRRAGGHRRSGVGTICPRLEHGDPARRDARLRWPRHRAAMDPERERRHRHGVLRGQHGLVHRLGRHPERGLLPDHRPAADPRPPVPGHRRRDLLPRRAPPPRVAARAPRRATRSACASPTPTPRAAIGSSRKSSPIRTSPASSSTRGSKATRRSSRGSGSSRFSRRTSTAADGRTMATSPRRRGTGS